MTVGPVPKYYVDACAGFCSKGEFDKSTLTCTIKPSISFKNCIDRIKPVNCQGSAFPVGVDGVQLYYANSATDAGCKETSLCIPAGGSGDLLFENVEPIIAITDEISQFELSPRNNTFSG